jgi:hypothetical protein
MRMNGKRVVFSHAVVVGGGRWSGKAWNGREGEGEGEVVIVIDSHQYTHPPSPVGAWARRVYSVLPASPLAFPVRRPDCFPRHQAPPLA